MWSRYRARDILYILCQRVTHISANQFFLCAPLRFEGMMAWLSPLIMAHGVASMTLSNYVKLYFSLSLFFPPTNDRPIQNIVTRINLGAKWPSSGKIGGDLHVLYLSAEIFFRDANIYIYVWKEKAHRYIPIASACCRHSWMATFEIGE